MVKRKIVSLDFIFSEEEFDLDAITEDYVRHVLKDRKMIIEGQGPSVIIHKIITQEDEGEEGNGS